LPSTASDSATLISLDADFVTINQYLAVIGTATITSLTVNQDFFVDKITSQTGTLALQPTGGIVNLADNTLIVASTGGVTINGTLSVTGARSPPRRHLPSANPASFDEQVPKSLASTPPATRRCTTQLITIASGGVATSSALATDVTTNATAGSLVPNTELTINSLCNRSNLVYPTHRQYRQQCYRQNKVDGHFTVAIDAPAT
jgi:hypothetical protein